MLLVAAYSYASSPVYALVAAFDMNVHSIRNAFDARLINEVA